MLVITRKDQEGFVILDDQGQVVAEVTVVKTTQGKAQVGIEAPKHIKVLRNELRG